MDAHKNKYIMVKLYPDDWKILNTRREAGETLASSLNRILEEYKHLERINQSHLYNSSCVARASARKRKKENGELK